MKTSRQRFRPAWLWLVLLVCVASRPVLLAQDNGGGAGLAPEVAGPEGNPGEPDASFAGPEGLDDLGATPAGPEADAGLRDQLNIDLTNSGFAVPQAAFEIFPTAVQDEIQTLVTKLLPLLEPGQEKRLATFFEEEGDQIATVFDQLGLEPTADTLIDVPSSTIKFPNEFENYALYLDSLELAPFERDYMLRSHEIAKQYEDGITSALGNRAMVQSTLEDYQMQLEALNERYAEQFREQSLESIERAGADGRRPDIDR